MAEDYFAAVISVGLACPLQAWGTKREDILRAWKVQETDTAAVTKGVERETGQIQDAWQLPSYTCFQENSG